MELAQLPSTMFALQDSYLAEISFVKVYKYGSQNYGYVLAGFKKA